MRDRQLRLCPSEPWVDAVDLSAGLSHQVSPLAACKVLRLGWIDLSALSAWRKRGSSQIMKMYRSIGNERFYYLKRVRHKLASELVTRDYRTDKPFLFVWCLNEIA